MRLTIKRWVLVVLVWLVELQIRMLEWWCPTPLTPPTPVDPVIAYARLTVRQTAALAHTGSYKAVVALKTLKARFPDRRARDLRLAIERAVQELP